jgi:uncharacterized protein (DUF1697 family)
MVKHLTNRKKIAFQFPKSLFIPVYIEKLDQLRALRGQEALEVQKHHLYLPFFLKPGETKLCSVIETKRRRRTTMGRKIRTLIERNRWMKKKMQRHGKL